MDFVRIYKQLDSEVRNTEQRLAEKKAERDNLFARLTPEEKKAVGGAPIASAQKPLTQPPAKEDKTA